jgi:hypothetical protein
MTTPQCFILLSGYQKHMTLGSHGMRQVFPNVCLVVFKKVSAITILQKNEHPFVYVVLQKRSGLLAFSIAIILKLLI